MRYKVIYSNSAKRQLRKLDPHIAKIIVRWINDHINESINPYFHGKALSANLNGLWRYRIMDYRVICMIKDETVTVEVLFIKHRKDVYKKF